MINYILLIIGGTLIREKSSNAFLMNGGVLKRDICWRK